MDYPYNIDYTIEYKKKSSGFLSLFVNYFFVIVEYKWKYYEDFNIIFEHRLSHLDYRENTSLYLQSKDLLKFTDLEEAEEVLKNFKRSSNVKCYHFMEHLNKN